MFSEEILAETVRKFPILYDKSSSQFKDRRKKLLAWTDVASAAGLPDGRSYLLTISIIHYNYIRLLYLKDELLIITYLLNRQICRNSIS